MGRGGAKFYLLLMVVAVAVCGCSKDADEDVVAGSEWTGAYGEQLVFDGLVPIDTAWAGVSGEVDYRQGRIYLCDHTVTGVLVGDDAVGEYDYSPWRLPTRKEAQVLKGVDVGSGDSRYLCWDVDGACWYSFKFGGGSVTKAGAKTKYNIRPVRVVYDSDSVIVYL